MVVNKPLITQTIVDWWKKNEYVIILLHFKVYKAE